MRKLLIVLSGLSSAVFANYLPNGNYEGKLITEQSRGEVVDYADKNKSKIENDTAYVVIPKLTVISATNGILTGQVVNMNIAGVDCFGGNAKFKATKFGIPISASDVKITNCKFSENDNMFTGNFSARVPLFGTQAGKFEFKLVK
jgi:hypothetical protein